MNHLVPILPWIVPCLCRGAGNEREMFQKLKRVSTGPMTKTYVMESRPTCMAVKKSAACLTPNYFPLVYKCPATRTYFVMLFMGGEFTGTYMYVKSQDKNDP